MSLRDIKKAPKYFVIWETEDIEGGHNVATGFPTAETAQEYAGSIPESYNPIVVTDQLPAL